MTITISSQLRAASILWFEDPAAADARRVGGKAAALARLADRLPVPAGFVVVGPVDAAMVQLAYAELADRAGDDEPIVAVRSSAADEDGIETSFGRHGPADDALAEAVGRVDEDLADGGRDGRFTAGPSTSPARRSPRCTRRCSPCRPDRRPPRQPPPGGRRAVAARAVDRRPRRDGLGADRAGPRRRAAARRDRPRALLAGAALQTAAMEAVEQRHTGVAAALLALRLGPPRAAAAAIVAEPEAAPAT